MGFDKITEYLIPGLAVLVKRCCKECDAKPYEVMQKLTVIFKEKG